MTSSDGSPDPDALDPAFEGLFRPSDIAPEAPVAAAAEAPDAAPEPRQPVSDTGRLFRSQGVTGHGETVLALETGRFTRLRTLGRDNAPSPAELPLAEATAVAGIVAADDIAQPEEMVQPAVVSVIDPASANSAEGGPMPDMTASSSRSSGRGRRGRRDTGIASSRPGATRGARAGVVYGVVIGVTVIVGFINALLGGGELGWPTGLALLASSVYGALVVQRDRDYAAFLIPPVAFLLAALTAGQVFLDANESSLLNRAVIVFFTLAENWIWIIGSTLVALVIVLVRRRRT